MKLFDLHQDVLLHIHHPEHFSGVPQTSLALLEQAEVAVVVATAFPVPQDDDWYNPALNQLITADFTKYQTIVSQNDQWHLVHTGTDLDRDGHGLLLHIEGLNTINNTPNDWEQLEMWYQQGWRSLGPVWNITNALAGGTSDLTAGLTDFGRQVLYWCLERNMIIDCAHMNRRSFYEVVDVLQEFKKPILVSHGNAASLCPDERNYTDEQLQIIARSGGVIGVFFSGAFVSKSPTENTLETVSKHIEHIKNVAGIDAVALGTDFGGITKGVPAGLETIVDTHKLLHYLQAVKGWSVSAIEQLAFANARRVIKEYLP